MKIINKYIEACNELAKEFANKHNLEFNEDYWIGDRYDVIEMADYCIDITTMFLDIKNDAPKDIFFEWYDYSVENETLINYYSWIKGFNPSVIVNSTFHIVENITGVNSEKLKSKSRKEIVVWTRLLFYVIIMSNYNYNMENAAKCLNRDRTTVINAIKTHLLYDKSYIKCVNQLNGIVSQNKIIELRNRYSDNDIIPKI